MRTNYVDTIRVLAAGATGPQVWRHIVGARDPNACWLWRGPRSWHGHPIARLRDRTISALRVTWFLAVGEYPLAKQYQRSCGNDHCVRPSHVQWHATAAARRTTAALSDGYWEVDRPAIVALECAAAMRGGAAIVEDGDALPLISDGSVRY